VKPLFHATITPLIPSKTVGQDHPVGISSVLQWLSMEIIPISQNSCLRNESRKSPNPAEQG
ncbi:MAG TPA: hypothetical protein DCL69_02785, partial [Firmicutes bacterium]|nr:hypothetical protein [Bacillota bacterium]